MILVVELFQVREGAETAGEGAVGGSYRSQHQNKRGRDGDGDDYQAKRARGNNWRSGGGGGNWGEKNKNQKDGSGGDWNSGSKKTVKKTVKKKIEDRNIQYIFQLKFNSNSVAHLNYFKLQDRKYYVW